MEGSGMELRSTLRAIESSVVVENRVHLLRKLADIDITEKSDLAFLAESLTTIWEGFTCLDVSQCMLNKAILHVAAKHIESSRAGCLGQFLVLGTKASIWCGKHLKTTLMSTGDSQEEEEHSTLFYQLLLDLLSFFTMSISSLTRHLISDDESLMTILETYIFEHLNLIKDTVSEVKRITSFGSEVLTAAQRVLDAVTELCRVYFQGVKWGVYDSKPEFDRAGGNSEQVYGNNHVLNITRCTIDMFCELGIVAANNGGSLVTILNVSWKGVINLLQLGKGALAVKVNVPKIILTLISLAKESLRCAAQIWSSSLKETVSSAEAKRTFVPAKFYLINAVRISLLYPIEALSLYKEITLSVLIISSFSISLSKETSLRAASEMLTEFLEPTSFILLKSILSSANTSQEQKFHILDWLLNDERGSNSVDKHTSCDHMMMYMDSIFTISCETMPKAKLLLLGRVTSFLYLLKSSSELEDDARLGLAQKLEWFLNLLVDEEVYSSVIVLQVPMLYGSGKSQEVVWQTLFSVILHTLKSFLIVVSSSAGWKEVMSFLLDNLVHPHVLCREIIMELWCFLVRYAETTTVNDIVDNFSVLLKLVASSSSRSVLARECALRTLAKSICTILMCCSEIAVNRFYKAIFNDERFRVSAHLRVALLMEGFPLNLLPDGIKIKATQGIIADYFGFIENFDDLKASGSGLFGEPVYALSAAIRSLHVSTADIDVKTLKFFVAVIHKYRNALEDRMKDHYLKLLSATLGIISNTKHLYESVAMEEVILELQKLFISREAPLDTKLHLCTSELAFFVAGLVHMKIVESDTCLKCSAVWELYHMLLKERHWALAHLAITAFGYYAERTTCSELWRFVPQKAALSFDLDTGVEATEDRFMLAMKTFLDKEKALPNIRASSEELGLLLKEGLVLKEMVQKITNDVGLDVMECRSTVVEDANQANKRRKLPDGINEGMELLQSGLKVIGDCLSQWQQHHIDSAELREKLFSHYSHLEDVIGHMAGLANTR